MKLEQFPQRDPFEGTEPFAAVILKEFLGFVRTKTLNHTQSVPWLTLYVKRYIETAYLSVRCTGHEFSKESSKIVHLGEPFFLFGFSSKASCRNSGIQVFLIKSGS